MTNQGNAVKAPTYRDERSFELVSRIWVRSGVFLALLCAGWMLYLIFAGQSLSSEVPSAAHLAILSGIAVVLAAALAFHTARIERNAAAHRRIEEALRISERQYHSVVDNLTEVIFQTDAGGHWRLLNPAWTEITGFSVSESLGKDFLSYIHPDDRNRTLRLVQGLLDGKRESYDHEVRYLARDGSVRWIKAVARLNRNDDGTIGGFSGTLSDITKRKTAELALRESEERFRRLAEHSPGIVYRYRLKPSPACEYVSPASSALLGYHPSEFYDDLQLGGHIVHPDERMGYEAHAAQRAHDGAPMQLRLIRKDGTIVWTEHYVVPIRDARGEVTAVEGTAFDVTARRLAEDAVSRSEKRFRTLLENSLDVVSVVDTNGTIRYQSPSIAPQLGYGPEELIGASAFSLIHPDDLSLASEAFTAVLREPSHPFEALIRLRRKDGEWRQFEGRGIYCPDFPEGPSILATFRDVSERKRTQEALKESEERYRRLVDFSPNAIIVHANGRIVFANPSAAALIGADSPDQLLGRDARSFLHRDFSSAVDKRIKDVVHDGKAAPAMEEQFIRQDGTPIDVEVVALPFSYNGAPAVQVVVRDITERKRAEAALKESERRYRELADALPETVYEADARGQITFANRSGLEMFGYTPADLEAGFDLLSIITPSQREEAQQRILTMFASGQPHHNAYLAVRKDGSTLPVMIHSVPIVRDGTVAGLRGIVVDVTEQKHIEEEIRKARDFYLTLFNEFPAMIWRSGVDGVCNYFNKTWLEFTGATLESQVNDGWRTLVLPGDLAACDQAYWDAFHQRRIYQAQYRLRDTTGNYRWVADAGRPFFDLTGAFAGYIGCCIDITDSKNYEQLITKSLREKDVLLKEIHHRVKNNMQIVSSLLNLQATQIKDPDARELFKESQNRIRTMALIHEKLYQSQDFARIDLADYLKNLIAQLSRSYTSQANSIDVRMDMEEVPLTVESAIPLGLLINELVTNALRHAFPDGRRGHITIRLHRSGENVTLEVQDDGVGFPENLDLRTPESLGLQLVTTLTAQVKGTLDLLRDKGTCLTVTFPCGLDQPTS